MGLFGLFGDPSQADPTQSGYSPGTNFFGTLGATLRDVGANLQGRPEDADNLMRYQQYARQMNAQRALQNFKTSGNAMTDVQSLAAAGVPIDQAIQYASSLRQLGIEQNEQTGYNNALASLTAPAHTEPNPVQVTPQVTDQGGQINRAPASAYQQPASSNVAAGALAGNPEIASLLRSLPPDQGVQTLMSLVGPHKAEEWTDAQGVAHFYDPFTLQDKGTLGSPKPLVVGNRVFVPNSGGDNSAPPSAAPSGIDEPTAQGFIKSAFPGATITSGFRTPAQNTAANGVPDSMHLSGQAVDFRAAPGTTLDAVKAQLQAAGFPATEVLQEIGGKPTTEPVFHVGWAPKGQAAAPQQQAQAGGIPGYQEADLPPVVQKVTTPAMAQKYNLSIGDWVDTSTGKPLPASEVPVNTSDPGIQAAGARFATTGEMGSVGRDAASQRAIRAAAVQYLVSNNPGMTPEQAGVQLATNELNFKGKQKALNNFLGGGPNSPGGKLQAGNNAVGHVAAMADLANALGNGNVNIINAARQRFQREFGYAAPTNFDALASVVGPEIIKSIVPGGGGEGERNGVIQILSKKGSPQQLTGALQTYLHAIGRQMYGTYLQYRAAGLGDQNEFANRFLSPDAQPYFFQAYAGAQGGKGGSQQGGSGTNNPRTVDWKDL